VAFSLYRVALIGSDFRQWPQDEGVVENLIPRQEDAVDLPGDGIIGEDVDIQGTGAESRPIPAPAVVILDPVQQGRQGGHTQGAVKPGRQVVKVVAGEAHRLALIDRRQGQVTEVFGESVEADGDMALLVDVAADTDVYPGHQGFCP